MVNHFIVVFDNLLYLLVILLPCCMTTQLLHADQATKLARFPEPPEFSKTTSLPSLLNYDQQKAEQLEQQLNSFNSVQLEQAGNKVFEQRKKNDSGDNGSAMTIIEHASSPNKIADKLNSFEHLDMFLRSDQIIQDPITLFNSLTNNHCREIESQSNQDRHYKVREVTENKTEIIEEIRSCEVPRSQFTCSSKLNISCEAKGDCAFGGLVAESVASDMKLEYGGGILTIGTISDNYWSGQCQVYDRDTEFTIKDVAKLSEFRLVQTGFDDFIQIKVNDHIVYIGPDGGSSLSVVSQKFGSGYNANSSLGNSVSSNLGTSADTGNSNASAFNQVFNGINYYNCEQGTNWMKDLDIDLRPYLKEGLNTISVRVIVSGMGEGWIKIAVKQHCCNSWKEEWVTDCL
jgi:hypothetical protein